MEKFMGQQNNQADFHLQRDAEIDIYTAENTDIKLNAYVVENEDLFINIPTRKNLALDVYITGDTNVYVNKNSTKDIRIITDKNNLKPAPDSNDLKNSVDNRMGSYIHVTNYIVLTENDSECPITNEIMECNNENRKVRIFAFTNKDHRIGIIINSDHPLDIYIDTRKQRNKLALSAREYRQAAHERKNNMHKAKNFDWLWLNAAFLNPEYLSAIAQTSLQFYSLYDIICYIYIGDYFSETYFINRKNSSLLELVSTISVTHIKNQYLNETINDDETENIADPGLIHFKGFQVVSTRKLKSFFDFILDSKSGFEIIKKKTNKEFNVFDYGFISYLLSPEADYDLNDLIQGNFEAVSSEFYAKIYIGLNLMAITHDISLDKEIITNIFINRLHRDSQQISKDIIELYLQ